MLKGEAEKVLELADNDGNGDAAGEAGGYGVGSKENFKLLHELATLIGGEVGATRAAVDAGFTESERQIGRTVTPVCPI